MCLTSSPPRCGDCLGRAVKATVDPVIFRRRGSRPALGRGLRTGRAKTNPSPEWPHGRHVWDACCGATAIQNQLNDPALNGVLHTNTRPRRTRPTRPGDEPRRCRRHLGRHGDRPRRDPPSWRDDPPRGQVSICTPSTLRLVQRVELVDQAAKLAHQGAVTPVRLAQAVDLPQQSIRPGLWTAPRPSGRAAASRPSVGAPPTRDPPPTTRIANTCSSGQAGIQRTAHPRKAPHVRRLVPADASVPPGLERRPRL